MKKRLVFMGSAAIACPSLDALCRLSEADVAGVVTQPERPKGRTLRPAPCPLCAYAQRRGLPLLMPENVNTAESLAALRAWQPDLIVVVAYGQILKPPLLSLPPLGCVNLHASLLPKYRGAAPIQWAIARGETETGVTTMFMNAQMDAGDIIFQAREPILPDDTAGSLHDRLAKCGAALLAKTVTAVLAGAAPRIPQDHAAATYAPRLTKHDGKIDWRQSSVEIQRRIRGFNPWPACHTIWPDLPPTTLKILRGRIESIATESNAPPGTVLECKGDGPLIKTGDGALRLLEVQPEGKKAMSGAAFLCGHRASIGEVCG